jgi:hypothetical protein
VTGLEHFSQQEPPTETAKETSKGRKQMKKKLMIGLIAGSAVFAAVFGAAASLGNITDQSLGANSQTVSSCDSDGVSTGYTVSYDATLGYKVDGVTVSGIAAGCIGKKLNVTLVTGATSTSLTQATIAGASETLTVSGGPAATDVDGIHVAING